MFGFHLCRPRLPDSQVACPFEKSLSNVTSHAKVNYMELRFADGASKRDIELEIIVNLALGVDFFQTVTNVNQ